MYEFPSEESDIGPFVSNEILWLKYKFCSLKSCFVQFVFDLDKVCLIGILYNHCIILLPKIGRLENKNFV